MQGEIVKVCQLMTQFVGHPLNSSPELVYLLYNVQYVSLCQCISRESYSYIIVIGEASRAICTMLSTLFFPILPWLFQAVWLLWFVAVLLYLMSNGIQQYEVTLNDTQWNLTAGRLTMRIIILRCTFFLGTGL